MSIWTVHLSTCELLREIIKYLALDGTQNRDLTQKNNNNMADTS